MINSNITVSEKILYIYDEPSGSHQGTLIWNEGHSGSGSFVVRFECPGVEADGKFCTGYQVGIPECILQQNSVALLPGVRVTVDIY